MEARSAQLKTSQENSQRHQEKEKKCELRSKIIGQTALRLVKHFVSRKGEFFIISFSLNIAPIPCFGRICVA